MGLPFPEPGCVGPQHACAGVRYPVCHHRIRTHDWQAITQACSMCPFLPPPQFACHASVQPCTWSLSPSFLPELKHPRLPLSLSTPFPALRPSTAWTWCVYRCTTPWVTRLCSTSSSTQRQSSSSAQRPSCRWGVQSRAVRTTATHALSLVHPHLKCATCYNSPNRIRHWHLSLLNMSHAFPRPS